MQVSIGPFFSLDVYSLNEKVHPTVLCKTLERAMDIDLLKIHEYFGRRSHAYIDHVTVRNWEWHDDTCVITVQTEITVKNEFYLLEQEYVWTVLGNAVSGSLRKWKLLKITGDEETIMEENFPIIGNNRGTKQ